MQLELSTGPVLVKDGRDDAVAFGRLIRDRREARGWSQEALAKEAFGSLDKSRISKIETGRPPFVTPDTARNVVRPLDINPEEVPLRFRWREAIDVTTNTNTIAHEIKGQVDKLVAAGDDRAREFGIREGMLIALARRYAEGSPGDFDAALAGLERALDVAHHERNRGRLPSNISEAVDFIVARIDALNESGDLEAAQAVLDAELAAFDVEDGRRRAERARLYQKGISQAILARNVENACRFVIAQIDIDASAGSEQHYELLKVEFGTWFDRGSDRGLNFDLEVAIALARSAMARAVTDEARSEMQRNLAAALTNLGQRESGNARLEEAVKAFRTLSERTLRTLQPLDWASSQHDLGFALQRLGERTGGRELLSEAVHAFREALERTDT